MDNLLFTERQSVEKNYYNSIVHNKWDNKSLLVEQAVSSPGNTELAFGKLFRKIFNKI